MASVNVEKQPLLSPNGGEDGATKTVQPSARKPILGKSGLVILYYATCSSSMLIINKVAVHAVPLPSFVLFCQLLTSALAVWVLERAGVLESDRLEWDKIKKFIWVIIGFLGTIFANIKVLQHANVETFITFRSSTPLVLSLCDYFFLGRALPNARSWGCLLVLLLGALGYVMVDAGFRVEAYVWLAIWYMFFTFDTVYVKHMCDTLKMTNWGRVFYTNFLALPPLMIALPMLNEQAVLATLRWDISTLGPLILSCLVGVCMSHSAYLLRENVSATYFTIVGILCKVVTVMINMVIWDNHASYAGVGFLLICVLAGTFYQQAPKRPAHVSIHATAL